MSHIGIIIAMQEEAELIIERLQLVTCPNTSLRPGILFQGQMDSLKISVLVNGWEERFQVNQIGPIPATLTAHFACTELKPDVLISAGTAGGFGSKGANIGTVYLSEKYCIFHDRLVPLPGYDLSGEGCYPVFPISTLASNLQLPQGVVSTGSSLLKKDSDLQIMEKHNAVAKEMEAAAIAWVCDLYAQPFFALKSITNLLDEKEASEEQFTKNLTAATQALTIELLRVLEYCKDRSLNSLK